MRTLVVNPTSTAQWQALVHDAQAACEFRLGEELESYLVFLLMRFSDRPQMATAVLALEYLNGLLAAGRMRIDQLRDVGDQCLLFSGLFPLRAERRRVKISYYVSLGRSAYHQLSESVSQTSTAAFYCHLSDGFVRMMDVLQAMRELNGCEPLLDPLKAFELWQETGSDSALRNLRQVTDAIPVGADSSKRH